MMKRISVLMLALVLSLGLCVPASAARFSDVPESSPFAASTAWAAEKGIANGTTPTTFAPGADCTTSHILTFLWRASGRPGDAGDERAAVSAWASGLGIDVSDLSAPCTRAAAVTYIWTALGRPEAAGSAAFTDLPAGADWLPAVAWAVEKGVTNGTGDGKFSPEAVCTRGQIVTFLHRAMGDAPAQPEAPAEDKPAPVAGKTLANGKAITVENVSEILAQLKEQYPGGTDFSKGYSGLNSGRYARYNCIDQIVKNYTTSSGLKCSTLRACGGWAAFVADAIFGQKNVTWKKTTIANVRPGDLLIDLDGNGYLTHVSICAGYSDGFAPDVQIQSTDAGGTPDVVNWSGCWTNQVPGDENKIDVYTAYPD